MSKSLTLTPIEDESLEVELDSKQCAEVALYMYQQWQEAMKPPVYAVYDFPTWLNKCIEYSEVAK